LNIGLCHLKRG